MPAAPHAADAFAGRGLKPANRKGAPTPPQPGRGPALGLVATRHRAPRALRRHALPQWRTSFMLELRVFRNGRMGGVAHFLFVQPKAHPDAWLESTVEGLGYELVDVERSRGGLIRLFIDRPEGISVDDCARVSNHLTRLFAVEGVAYDRLEVSSPGLDRVVRRLQDFARFEGQRASIRLKLPREGRRRLEGVLQGIEGESVLVEVEGRRWSVPLVDIERARLVPEV